MRVNRSERVGRKPFHCLSMRQRRRIRQEIKLMQESAEAEFKRKQALNENESQKLQPEQALDNRVPEQAVTQGPGLQNVVYVSGPQQHINNKVPQYVVQPNLICSQSSTNSYSTSDEVDPFLQSALSYPIHLLPGPSSCPLGTQVVNGMPPTAFKTEPFVGHHQEATNIGLQQSIVLDRNTDILLELKKLNKKLDTYNDHLSSINIRLESIETHIKQEKRKGQAPVKPSIIPMQTVQEVIDFDNASDEVYDELVQYLKYIGGFTLREALNLCMKEVLTNDVANSFTWHGKDTGHAQVGIALYNRQITNAFYEAVSQSQHFDQPTRVMFAAQMREVLRIAKQRLRNSLRKQQIQQNFDGDRDEDPWE